MPFYPPSKLTVKYTPGNEFIRRNSQMYVGDYIETSDGRYFEGNNKKNLKNEIYLDFLLDEEGTSGFGGSKHTRVFNVINDNTRKYLEKVSKVPTFKTFPTEENYEIGYYKRYFLKRINGSHYMEISKKVHDSILAKEGKYDHNLYIIGKINWHLIGNTIIKKNSEEILKAQNRHPNLLQTFPILDEFARSSGDPLNNQETFGGELYYADGTEFIGFYHIHPEKGPMEGAVHTFLPHSKLYYFNQLPQPDDTLSYDDYIATTIVCYQCLYPLTPSATVAHINVPSTDGCPDDANVSYLNAALSCFDSDFANGGNGEVSGSMAILNNLGGEISNGGTSSGGGGGGY